MIRFNEWICLSAQYEKALARLGRQVYQAYSRGILDDFPSIELCKEISETFSEARMLREELEEELERDALDGLNVEESKKAEELLKLTQAQKTKKNLKLKFHKLMGRTAINRALATHRDRVKELSRELGERAVNNFRDQPVIKVRGHRELCKLAARLDEDAGKKWDEIVEGNEKGAAGLSFHTTLLNFAASFANFSKGTHLGKWLLKFFKYDEQEEQDKLSKQYEGSSSAGALKAQMEEIDEPHLDVGREIVNMQQEYEEAPDEWNFGEEQDPEPEPFPSAQQPPAAEEEPENNLWGTESEAWEPEDGMDEDFLDVVSEVAESQPEPEPEPEPEPKPAPKPEPRPTPQEFRPTLLRNKPGGNSADPWKQEEKEEPSPLRGAPQSVQKPKEEPEDWGWGTSPAEEDPFAPSTQASESSSGSPQLASALDTSEPDVDPFTQYGEMESAPATSDGWGVEPKSDDSATGDSEPGKVLSKPGGSKPPFVRSQKKEQPLGDWSVEESPKPSDPPPSPAEPEPDYGWGTPAPSKPEPKPEEAGPEPIDYVDDPSKTQEVRLPIEDLTGDNPDPLLRLLGEQSKSEISAPPSAADSDEYDDLGDDLLPAFLKERSEEEEGEGSTFIPELPSFLESDDGPQLEIVPFGTQPKEGQAKKDGEDSSDESPPKKPE